MNAKEEFIITVANKSVKCAIVTFNDILSNNEELNILLPVNYTSNQYDEFLKQLDFNYDAGYGIQMITGNIWFKDNTWCDRGEYDGSEWWDYQRIPNIPEELIN